MDKHQPSKLISVGLKPTKRIFTKQYIIMGQKVNPRGFRIGINNLWRMESQCYGKNFTNTRKLYKKTLPSTNYLNKLFESKMLTKGEVYSRILDNKWYCNVSYAPLVFVNDVSIQFPQKSLSVLLNIEVQNYKKKF